MRQKGRSRYSRKPAWQRALEWKRARLPNRIPVIRQIRRFQARRQAFKRRAKGTAARILTFGYIKPLSHPKLKPCTKVRAALRRAYFGFKALRNWNRGGNRAKDFRPKKVAKSRFTVLNCK